MIENIIFALGIIILLCVLGIGLCHFFSLSKKRQKEIILEWLLLAVVLAEKELGDGTGQIKLRFVYDLFIDKFKFISYFVSFAQFSKLVDQALDRMKDIMSNNKQVQEYINK